MMFKGHFIYFSVKKCLLMFFVNFSVGLLIIFLLISTNSFHISEIIHYFVCAIS